MGVLRLLLCTVILRPYVFAFLAVYLVAACMKIGVKKAVFFTLSAWAVAYASEFSSVRNGFPFGLYEYIPNTACRELWVFGVPFMDSLSFTFLAYASWSMARVFFSPSAGRFYDFAILEEREQDRFSLRIILLGSFLMMLLDIVVDPLTLRGDRWFLGKIYYYPEPGPYFGVTIRNFIGWFVVGAVTMTLWRVIDRAVNEGPVRKIKALDLSGPALYFIILFFNLAVTFYIGEFLLGLAGVMIFFPVAAFFVLRLGGAVLSHPQRSRSRIQ